jgi:hypothetical protein
MEDVFHDIGAPENAWPLIVIDVNCRAALSEWTSDEGEQVRQGEQRTLTGDAIAICSVLHSSNVVRSFGAAGRSALESSCPRRGEKSSDCDENFV